MSAACQSSAEGQADADLGAQALLARETLVRIGSVPASLGNSPDAADGWVLQGDSFLLREGDIAFHYRRGEGVVMEAPPEADQRDVALWLNGTVYAAVAALNGLLPLHASAVAHEGRVYAFSGPPGAGKSTLAAALGRVGMPLFCDDTLIIDVRDETAAPICLPGHKRLKLWPEGIILAGATALEQVASHYPKHFAAPAAGQAAEPLPLGELLFLAQGASPAVEPLSAGERIASLQDDHYTADLFARAGGLSRAGRFELLGSIARRIAMARLRRPFSPDQFDQGLAFAARHIRESTVR